MIIGGPGSGKSTLARRLGEETGLPVHHMDQIHWMPGWRERPLAAKLAMAREIEGGDAWIFEGGLSTTYEARAARADLIVWLDLPLWLSLWRVLRRIARWYGRSRPDLPEGCPEQIDLAFLRWIVTSDPRTRARNRALVERHPDKSVRLRSQLEIDDWLHGLSGSLVPA